MKSTVSPIGLDSAKSLKLAGHLNNLLANYEIFYQNVRGFHWNIRGDKFFELHAKFEELFNDALVKIDEVAERILALGDVPLHTFSSFINHSDITEIEGIHTGKECVKFVEEYLKILVQKEREIVALAAQMEDDGTQDLLNPYITSQEKTLWMLRAYLSE